jgi:cytoskeletal protein CcmA (bactofilin family)
MVATAIIDGSLRGDIHATERVELGSHAKVFGNIKSPALSIQTGAVFEGECHFLPSPYEESGEDNEQMQSSSSMFSRPATQGYPGVNHEAGEEEAEALAVAAGR